MRLAFTTEYDGSIFSGFQRQKNADSVQQNIEEALEKITQEKVVINYAGRTDAGVHAYLRFLISRQNLKDQTKTG